MGKLNYQKAAWKQRHETNISRSERDQAAKKAHSIESRLASKKVTPSQSPSILIPPKYPVGAVIKKHNSSN